MAKTRNESGEMKNNGSFKNSLKWTLLIITGVIIYAYGFQVTQVSLDKTREPRRQESFVRILRALAHPDIFEKEQKEVEVNTPIYIPCPEPGWTPPEPDKSGPYMQVSPPCGDPNSQVTIEGFNFAPNQKGPLNLIPPSQVTLQRGQVETDDQGHFKTTITLPRRQPTPEVQQIQAITRQSVGQLHLSRNGRETWNKIIETIFLALLATTIGTFLAVPVSFLAAHNIMKDVTSPLASVSLSTLAWPAGVLIGILVAR